MKTTRLACLCSSLCALFVEIAIANADEDVAATTEKPGVEVHAVAEGPDWVPMEYRRDIVPGSALDFSGLGIHDAPAGKYGWLVSRNGHAEFERRPGVPARFYGVNLCNSANYLPDDEIERVTDRLVRLGYNAVRIHHHDDAWADAHARRESEVQSPKSEVQSPKSEVRSPMSKVDRPEDPGTESNLKPKRQLKAAIGVDLIGEAALNAVDGVDDAIDRLDALMAACIRKGIYLTTDLYVSRRCTWRELGVDRDGDADMQSAKLLMLATDAGFKNWKRFARAFLTHVNPYTGRCLAEEPAMPMLVIVNESSPHSDWGKAAALPEFRALWAQWLAEARAANPGAYAIADPEAFPEKGGWWDPSPENDAKAAFWAWCCGRFSKRAAAFLRDELGVRALLSTENNGPVLPGILRMRAAAGDYVDFHFYTEHAAPASAKAREVAGVPIIGVFRNHNPLQDTRGMYPDVAFNRVWGRPLVVSESQMGGPNFNRAMGGLLTGTFAAVQDWTGIWTFAYAHSREKLFDGIDAEPGRFDLSLDPLMQATDRLPALLFLRGDQATPEAAFANAFSAEAMRGIEEGHPLASRPKWAGNGLEWRARLGVAFEGEPPAPSTLTTKDTKHTKEPPGSGDVSSASRVLRFDALAGEPPALPEVPSCGVSVDGEKGSIVVAGERTCAGFVGAGESFEAGALRASVRGHPALVAAASLGAEPLASASRILVWHLTDLHGEGFSWGGDTRQILYWKHTGILSWGTPRLLLHAGEADISLGLLANPANPANPTNLANPANGVNDVTGANSFQVFALGTNGRREGEIPSSFDPATGVLRFTASSRQPFGGCMHYEIVRRTLSVTQATKPNGAVPRERD